MHELAGAFNKLIPIYPHCKLILVGNFEHELDPLDRKDLDFLQNNRNIKLMGYQRDVRPFLFAANAFTFPSYREGFPNVVMQAGAMGLASIVTNINGCNEIIKNGENGIIIPPRNTTELFIAIKDFIENPQKKQLMAEKAREMIRSRYEQRDVWNALLKTYRELEK